MVSLKIICAIAVMVVFAPTCRAAAVTTESPETTDLDDVDENVDGDGDDDAWRTRILNNFLNYFTAIGDWIWREEQVLSTFDTQTCNSPQTGPCTFRGFQLIDTNCTIYTIGNCSGFVNENADLNCDHKCKLPSSSNPGDDGNTTDTDETTTENNETETF